MPIAFALDPSWHFKITSFVQQTAQNPDMPSLLSLQTNQKANIQIWGAETGEFLAFLIKNQQTINVQIKMYICQYIVNSFFTSQIQLQFSLVLIYPKVIRN